ncbi:MAG: glycosyltransferase [Methylocystis sp.]|nr:glycosyltransferase [Methylocystis sp.]MCA3583990.1 glycosyltransferase [Methylocystis sp.]MCA3588907.1 glycosyltransferase [Methylocystis sp.]MCA3592515.1 glycosyltransferase [Methylocystis sp.]
MLKFTGERIVPEASNCEPTFARKMYQEHLARYAFAANFARGADVIDVGCGVGYGSQFLAKNGAKSVFALDISEEAIIHASKYYIHPAVTFRVASAIAFDYPNSADLVTCFELIEHVQDQESVIRNIHRALRPGGILVISSPRPLSEIRSQFHEKELQFHEFKELLESHFSCVKPFFESNFFTSYIGDSAPPEIKNLIPITDRFEIGSADYFVFIASDRSLDERGPIEPLMVINDDSYILNLEKDVSVLRQAENAHIAELASLRQILNEKEVALTGLAALQANNQRLNSDKELLERENANLRDIGIRLDAVYRSTSWRISRPIRGLGRVLRRFRQTPSSHPSLPVSAPAQQLKSHSTVKHDVCGAPNSLDVLFLIGCWEGESKRYRVHNLVEGFHVAGYTTSVMGYGEARKIVENGLRPAVVVFFRAPFDARIGVVDVLDYCQANGIKTIFDIDDYVFEPDIINQIAGVDLLSASDRKQYEWGVRAYRALMMSTDIVTVTTPFLAERARELGRNVKVIPNSVNAAQKERARHLRTITDLSDDSIRIGYFSGSRTHARDFEQCAEALRNVLLSHSNVSLRIVGFLDLDERWDALSDRIERLGFMPYLDMLDSIRECDINLAPLEEKNPFCEAKSELKFFEAALVEVPTVSSRTGPFVAAIVDGETGFLASSEQEWHDKLVRLVSDAALRERLGRRACDAALSKFDNELVAASAAIAYGLELPHVSAVTMRDDALKIAWIIPGLIIGGGGHRNILRAAYHLERFGHDVRLYFIDTPQSAGELRRAVRQHFYPFDGKVRRFEGSVEGEDVIMATHWSTVAPAEKAADGSSQVFYFVQDFEPAFYAMGSDYILAENTYRRELYAITSGPWCERLLKSEYAMDADHFQFPIDRSIYFERPEIARKKRVIFFAKPDMPRRCFEIGVQALRALHKFRPEFEILLFGSNQVKNYDLGFPATVSGILPGIDDLAKLYASAYLGIAFSTTNPSLVPYEMMACGLPIVDLGRPGNEVNYGDHHDIALLAHPEPARMAAEIDALLSNEAELDARRRRGLEFAKTFPTEQEMARRVEALILQRVRKIVEAAG